ncbi:hypothetical protein LOK49_LG06G02323 [Camellia lanceoleosa]|uniref:Uncharacterized protein n=1 Tax=Camellia lanceoleosa TaxID=1840588 RepID=A0ACC0HCU7_9ERIC|nr:hypothetical protein LOK49_LG06G02323 [Camellia lanceoleosa]
MKKRPQLKPLSNDNNVDNNIHDNLDQLFDNLLDQLGGNVVPETPKVSGMPTFGIPIQDGGIGFDYRLHMAIVDKWLILTIKSIG